MADNPITHQASRTQTPESQSRNYVGEVTSDFWTAVKKTPGNIVGGGVDLMNIIAGAFTGEGTKGLVEEPVGGSAWINKKFDMPTTGKESPVQQVSEFLGGMVNPSGASKAMIVGLAGLPRSVSKIDRFLEMEREGKSAAKLFEETKLWRGEDPGGWKGVRTIISDQNAKILEAGLTELPDGKKYIYSAKKLSDLIDHPELFRRYPKLRDINVEAMQGDSGEAAFSAAKNTMYFAGVKTLPELRNAILHELQHAVQGIEGFAKGSGPDTEFMKRYSSRFIKMKDKFSSPPASISLKSRDSRLKKVKAGLEDKAYTDYTHVPGEQEAAFTELTKDQSQQWVEEMVKGILETPGRTPQNYLTKDAR